MIKYSIDRGGILNLALRATGDREISTTTGVTFDIMVRDYGVPIPRPLDLLRTQLQEVEETPSIPTPAPTVTQ
ncbi:MAG: hypothetical protein KatS3mg057_2046 [Herpetosiphonaceae bacterium]|nr:MAG: hypothetical protein KatS3mg057_2046 [Herpetosiphonaceae bacterium]